MNQYKLAWMQECTAEFDIQHPNKIQAKASSPTVMKQIKDHVVEHAVESVVTAAVFTGLSYMATNQFANPYLRTAIGGIGKLGVRAIPIVGVAYTAYSIYDWITD